MYREEIKREDKIKKVNNRARLRFCSGVVVLRMRLSVIRNLTEPCDWLKGFRKSRATLSRIRKMTTPLQNRSLINSNETKIKLRTNTSFPMAWKLWQTNQTRHILVFLVNKVYNDSNNRYFFML
jgi:hypothetical protein